MTRPNLEELIFDIVGVGEASPFEIAEELTDVSPSNKTRELVVDMVVRKLLVMDSNLNVRLPIPDSEERQRDS